MFSFIFMLLSLAASVLAIKNPLTVNLGDCLTYTGTDLGNGINRWLGIRFAAPPLEELRFRAPQPPDCNATVQQATEHGPICFGTGDISVPSGCSEDCLFLDVYAPTQNNPNTTEGGWPVFIFIQGGGLNDNGNPNMNAVPFIQSSGNNFVVVTFNYRVGPYGFLTSKEIQDDGDLNVGLLDQREVFKWVQSYISLFGGNPNHVVLGGDSAGAGSIDLHLSAYGGRDDHLFHATAAESQSFGAQFTVEGSQYQYDALVERVGCDYAAETLCCLRSISTEELQSQNIAIPTPGGAGGTPVYMYSAVIDGDFVRNNTYNAYANGEFIKVPVIFGDCTNEGTVFVPNTIANYSQANAFLKDNFITITDSDLANIDDLYPPAETFPNTGAFWRTTSNMYGEMRYNCPGIYLSSIFSQAGVPSYNYRWNVEVPASIASGFGVPHTAELPYIWGGSSVSDIQGYWTSFIRSFDPNLFMPEGSLRWETWEGEEGGGEGEGEGEGEGMRRILFESGDVSMESVPQGRGTQGERCAFNSRIGASLQQ